jgi:hypothetical protein
MIAPVFEKPFLDFDKRNRFHKVRDTWQLLKKFDSCIACESVADDLGLKLYAFGGNVRLCICFDFDDFSQAHSPEFGALGRTGIFATPVPAAAKTQTYARSKLFRDSKLLVPLRNLGVGLLNGFVEPLFCVGPNLVRVIFEYRPELMLQIRNKVFTSRFRRRLLDALALLDELDQIVVRLSSWLLGRRYAYALLLR